MRHRTSAQTKAIEAELQARRQAAYAAMILNREACGLDNHGAGGCSDPDCPTRREN